jgi:oligogalacturonide lyase
MITEKPLFPLRAMAAAAALSFVAGFPVLARADAPAADGTNLPKTWIDPDTGHRVFRLTSEPGSASLYFNDHGYTVDGKDMIYTTGEGDIGVVNLSHFETRIVVKGPVQAISVGHRTRTVFFARATADPYYSTLWSADLDTGVERKLADLPRRGKVFTINADETMAAGTFIVGDGEDYGSPGTLQVNNLDQPANKSEMMATRLAARLPMWIYTVNLRTGKTNNLLFGTDWLNHLQFSPSDPTLLMYCHEGQWWHVDRIWTIRTDGTQNTLIHKRTMEMEIAGHEWWGADGQNIWYQLNYPRGMNTSFVASYNVDTGERIWYRTLPEAASIHHNTSPDGTLFCGDGNRQNPWIIILTPIPVTDDRTLGTNLIKSGTLKVERLVNMSKHDYKLEPNASFTPDQKYIMYRSNIFNGVTYAFAVEVAKADVAQSAAP